MAALTKCLEYSWSFSTEIHTHHTSKLTKHTLWIYIHS